MPEAAKSTKNSFVKSIISFSGKFIDYPSAIAGAVIMGIMVGIINYKFGTWPAATAAFKQAAYTFLFGGAIIRLLYYIVLAIPGKITSLVVSVFIASGVTISLVYLVHSLKGTPLPLESTIPTALLAPPGFLFLALRRRRASVGGRLSSVGGRRSAVSGRRSAVSGRRSAVSGQRSAVFVNRVSLFDNP
jgi:hypothetical protein